MMCHKTMSLDRQSKSQCPKFHFAGRLGIVKSWGRRPCMNLHESFWVNSVGIPWYTQQFTNQKTPDIFYDPWEFDTAMDNKHLRAIHTISKRYSTQSVHHQDVTPHRTYHWKCFPPVEDRSFSSMIYLLNMVIVHRHAPNYRGGEIDCPVRKLSSVPNPQRHSFILVGWLVG